MTFDPKIMDLSQARASGSSYQFTLTSYNVYPAIKTKIEKEKILLAGSQNISLKIVHNTRVFGIQY